MSKDNDGLCAAAEAFVYGAMTHPMVFFRAFHAAMAVEMLSPRWVPRAVHRVTTTSPSATCFSTVKLMSGKAK